MRESRPSAHQVEWIEKLAKQMLWHLRKNRLDQAGWVLDRYYEALIRARDKNLDLVPLTRMWWTVTEPETVWGRGL